MTPQTDDEGWQERLIRVDLAEGLHARPAGRLVALLTTLDVEVEVRNHVTGVGPASGRSLTSLATLGVLQGQVIHIRARGPESSTALQAIESLAARGFDEGLAPVAASIASPPTLHSPSAAIVGQPASRGIALAPARRLHRRPSGRKREIGTPPHETAVLQSAIAAVRDELRRTRDAIAVQAGAVHAEILDTQVLILGDEALAAPALAAIRDAQASAEEAWGEAVKSVADRYRALEDPYQRARASDIDEIGRLVIARMAGVAERPTLWGEGILLASDLGPAETAALDLTLVKGIATAEGGPTSHTAILAKALGIPAAVGLGPSVLTIVEGTPVLLNGDAGTLTIDPDPSALASYDASPGPPKPSRVTRSGVAVTAGLKVEVGANIGLLVEMDAFRASDADSVGLLRTEMLFLERTTAPSVEEQRTAYAAICGRAGGRPVTIRTLDSGSDKPLAYLAEPTTANPALGVRGVRRGLAETHLLATQARAILSVAAQHPVRIMFPMIATVQEWRRARDIVENEIDLLGWSDRRPNGLKIGAMIEVPAAAVCADFLAAEVDFFSIGTNDLAQYTMAADRTNPGTSALADALHPAVLRLIGEVCGAAEANGRPVGVCGEIASDPLALPILVGLGVDSLSVAPSLVGEVRRLAAKVRPEDSRAFAAEAVSLESADQVRARATAFLDGR